MTGICFKFEWRDAIKKAQAGDVENLRKRYPDIAEFIHPPKLGRGKKYPKPGRWDEVRKTVSIIRLIWLFEYDKQRRHPDDGPSAEEIAAAYHGLDVSEVSWKPGGRHKPGPHKRRAK